MKKLTRFLTALLLTFALFAHAEMVDTYAFKNQAARTRAVELAKSLRCPQCQPGYHSADGVPGTSSCHDIHNP